MSSEPVDDKDWEALANIRDIDEIVGVYAEASKIAAEYALQNEKVRIAGILWHPQMFRLHLEALIESALEAERKRLIGLLPKKRTENLQELHNDERWYDENKGYNQAIDEALAKIDGNK